ILLDTLQTTGLADKIQEKVHDAFDGPVLVIDQKSPYFPSVMNDHRTPIRRLVDHLIDVHHYKDIVFLNGRETHIHSIQRLMGYKDSMEAHGLPVIEDNIYHGDYWYTSGKRMVEQMLLNRKNLPEAIACANDCMAIGVCCALEEHDIKVPDDIAVIGYDSIEDGRYSPTPLTSAEIPAKVCGKYSLQWIDASLNGQPIPDYVPDTDLWIGGSCGCSTEHLRLLSPLRDHWETRFSSESYYSCFNHLMEDLLSQHTYHDFFNIVFQYTYQLGNYDSFHICLNDNWDHASKMTGDNAIRTGYSKRIYPVVHCNKTCDSENHIDFSNFFDVKLILPEIHEEHETPMAYIFTPLHFDDQCFGYAAISYGNEPRVYDESYSLWLHNVMQGMESFYRQDILRQLLKDMECAQIRDSLTGLYNYRGLIAQTKQQIAEAIHTNDTLSITSIDLSGLKDINASYGRTEGDYAITVLAHLIQECAFSDEICARTGNDDFIVCSLLTDKNTHRPEEFISALSNKIQIFNLGNKDSFQIHVCYVSKAQHVNQIHSIEQLINDTISEKNGKKLQELQQKECSSHLSEKDKEQDVAVMNILDNNQFVYYFQPIVDAHTGKIFSYEALMRTNTEQKISPLDILTSAKRIGRLYDVEKATLFNVLHYMEEHPEKFAGKKTFINSIPGAQLVDADKERFHRQLGAHSGQVVVELTEQEELDNKCLFDIKQSYAKLKVETAIDDYGSGYSNINNLLRYMPKYVKIDRLLMEEIHNNPQKQHFVKDIIDFAHDNNILTLAEGIETSEELKEVIRLGVDLIQGYYTARPNPEPLEQIDPHIQIEILEYNKNRSSSLVRKDYIVDKPQSISLVQMALNKYTDIHIAQQAGKDHPIELIGATGFQSNLRIWFEDCFHGTLILNTTHFSTEKCMPWLELGESVDLTIQLKGNTALKMTGIRVPKSSNLHFVGEN
ncbi:MAG: EAL domain-containing protein, partial [Eubacterium sp.]